MRGTAILARYDFPLNNVTRLPPGRAIAAEYNGVGFINVYAPTGSAKRADREQFFNLELPELLYATPLYLLIGGDFNCVLQPADTTGHFITSRVYQGVVQGRAPTDAWNQDPRRPAFTHHSPTSATRIDRFYVSKDLAERKTGIEILPAAFTGHDAVVLCLSVSNV
jgi:exonuclease III